MLLCAAETVVETHPLDLTTLEIFKRLVCAMFIGCVIGTERELAHRPAGMRTGMMVCTGACAVMITSQLIFAQYNAFGATPDPARLSAQVISGVGFLGAGMIMHEGLNVRGLTTAASLWVVACLGIAAGGGYYSVALLSTACIFVTLTIFKRLQNKFLENSDTTYSYIAECADITNCLKVVNVMAQRYHATISDIQVEHMEEDDTFDLKFTADFLGMNSDQRRQEFLQQFCNTPGVKDVRCQGKIVNR